MPHQLLVLRQLLILQRPGKLRRNKQSLLGLQLQLQAPTRIRQQLIKLKRLALQLRLQAQWHACARRGRYMLPLQLLKLQVLLQV